MAVSFAPGTMMLHSAEDALVHEIAEIFAQFVQSKGAKTKADSAYIKSHLEVLGLDKMCLALEQKYGEPPMEPIQEAFSLFDADGDGHITPEELLEMLSTVDNNLEEDTVSDLMAKADLDGDGVISFDEFYQLIMGKPPPANSPPAAKKMQIRSRSFERSHTLSMGAGRTMADALEEDDEEEGVAKDGRPSRTPPRPQTPPDEDEPKPRGLAGSLAVVAQSATMDGGSTTEEDEEQPLSLQDQIDDALDGSFNDVAAMRVLLAQAEIAGHSHPSVMALEMKVEDLGGLPGAAPKDDGRSVDGGPASMAGKLLMGGLKAPIVEPEPEPEEAIGAVSKPGLLTVKVWEARNIPKMDRFGTTDAFAAVNCGVSTCRNSHHNWIPRNVSERLLVFTGRHQGDEGGRIV